MGHLVLKWGLETRPSSGKDGCKQSKSVALQVYDNEDDGNNDDDDDNNGNDDDNNGNDDSKRVRK